MGQSLRAVAVVCACFRVTCQRENTLHGEGPGSLLYEVSRLSGGGFFLDMGIGRKEVEEGTIARLVACESKFWLIVGKVTDTF